MSLLHDHHRLSSGFPYMNPSAPVQYTKTQPHHGIKRSASQDEVETSTHISSHFKKLRLNNLHATNGNPSPSNNAELSTNRTVTPQPTQAFHDPPSLANHVLPTTSKDICPPRSEDFMPVDDTPNRVYIADLDREIAEIEADESRFNASSSTFFLPDVDKNISKIPQNLLRQSFDDAVNGPRGSNEQALVLYRDPSSISVPEEEDAVRKAIIQARKEARKKIKQEHERETQGYATSLATDGVESEVKNSSSTGGDEIEMDDPLEDEDDAMEIE